MYSGNGKNPMVIPERRSEHSSRPKTRSKPARSISSDNSSTSVEDTEEEESSNGRKKGGKSLGRGSRGNWSESPSMTRPPYKAGRGQETVWKALHQISHSPFLKEIERAHLPGKFSSPNYVMYDGRADPIGHINHYRQSMALHLGNDALMCRMFSSSLGPMSLRWYWEVYNEVDGCTEEIAIKTFKLGLDPESEPRHNLSRRPAKSMRDLMSRIEQFVRVEDDRTRTRAVSTQGRPPKKPASMEQRRTDIPAKNLGRFPQPRDLGGVHTVAEGSVISKKLRTDFPNSEQQIFFSDEDLRDVQTPHDDPLVVKLRIGDSDVKRVLIDQGSCSEIMYPDLFHGLGLKQSDLQPYDAPLVGFSGESVRPMGRITMAVHTGPISLETEFLVVNVPSPYTAIMGRRWATKSLPSNASWAAIKQNPPGAKQKGKIVAECSKGLKQLEGVGDTCTEKCHETYEPCEELETVAFSSDPEKYFKIGRELSSADRTELIDFLTSNIDVFAWDPYEVPGVDPDYIQHRLNVDPHCKPVQQKARRAGPNTCGSSTKRGREIIASKGNKGAAVPHMALQHGGRKEKEREVGGLPYQPKIAKRPPLSLSLGYSHTLFIGNSAELYS
uniref:Retrotransposon gag domain-containing protein n=1 Tax=Fagus sylvatica TaxID=28930 RepID=A0A2N9HGB5_FAGSY